MLAIKSLFKKSSFSILFFITFAYKFITDFSYNFFIYPTYSYIIGDLSFSIIIYIFSLFFLIYALIYLTLLKNSFMYIPLFIVLNFAIIPSLTMMVFRPTTFNAIFMTFLYWIILINSMYFVNKIKFLNQRVYEFDFSKYRRYVYYVLTFSFIIVIYANIKYVGFRILTTFDIYDFRSEFGQISMPVIFDYLFLLINYSLLPVSLILSLKLKSKIGLILSFFVALLLFSLDGAKTVIFNMLIVILVFAFFYKVTKVTQFFIRFTLFLFFSYLISIFIIDISIWPIALLYRALLIPQEISFIYIEFIDLNEPLYLRDSIFRFLKSPYPAPLSYYITNFQSNSTNGFIGDAYANFKIFGILFYPVIISIVIKIISELYNKIDVRFFVSIFMIIIWVSINASFFTWLLSGGVIMIMLLSFFLKKF